MEMMDTTKFIEGREYCLFNEETRLERMVYVKGSKSMGSKVFDFARRDEDGRLLIYWLFEDQIVSQNGENIEADINRDYLERIIQHEKVRFEFYDSLLGGFGK